MACINEEALIIESSETVCLNTNYKTPYTMTAKDQLKLLKAGFTIIRPEVSPVEINKLITRKIKAKTPNQHEWHTLETGFTTDVSFKKRIAKLLESPKTVQD